MNKIKSVIAASIEVKKKVLEDEFLLQTIAAISEQIIQAFRRDNKIWFCGNGGSAADAQHIAAELSGRFYFDRPPLFAEALHVNTSYLTAVANDYGFDQVYARLIEGFGSKGDILVSLSTSGNSPNVIKAMEQAKKQGLINVALTGQTGGKLKEMGLTDYLVNVPSIDTPRIQEVHILVGHIVCELVEKELFSK
ncbi:MAG: D-sedoheptulose 7-phosphate isomerase [Chitinophagales bacterium]